MPTSHASEELLGQIRALIDDAFGPEFTQQDWEHTTGGMHFFVEEEGAIVGHASVIERTIEIDGRPFRTGYVEGVGTARAMQGRGLGSIAMEAATDFIRSGYEMGALATDRHSFYERLGWERWRGPTYVRRGAEMIRSEQEDDGVMVLRFGPSAKVRLDAPISCEERAGDDW